MLNTLHVKSNFFLNIPKISFILYDEHTFIRFPFYVNDINFIFMNIYHFLRWTDISGIFFRTNNYSSSSLITSYICKYSKGPNRLLILN